MKSKRVHVLLHLALGITVLLAATRVWVVYELEPGAAAVDDIRVPGQEGLAALLPISVALLAASVTLGIAGRGLRTVVGVLVVIMGAWIAGATLPLITGNDRDILMFGRTTLQETLGLASPDHSTMVAHLVVSVWPTVTLIVGIAVALAGVCTLVLGWGWKRGGAKYETGATSTRRGAVGDRISDWDALSSGDDPSTDGSSANGSTNSSENR